MKKPIIGTYNQCSYSKPLMAITPETGASMIRNQRAPNPIYKVCFFLNSRTLINITIIASTKNITGQILATDVINEVSRSMCNGYGNKSSRIYIKIIFEKVSNRTSKLYE